MKNRSILFPLALTALLALSLFSYTRDETFVGRADHITASQRYVDGAFIAGAALIIALLIVGHRISRAISALSLRAGLPHALPVPFACRIIIAASIPFFMFSWSSTSSSDSVHTTFAFGASPHKLEVFLLVLLFVWLVALLERLRALSQHILNQPKSNATVNA